MIPRVRYCLCLTLLILISGCLSKPDLPAQSSGSLAIQMEFKETNMDNRDIQSIKGALSINDGELVQEKSVVYHGPNTTLTFDKVYPGSCSVTVSAIDSAKDTIFLGTTEVSVISDSTQNATISMKPASASLEITFDTSPVPGKYSAYNGGRFGIYFNPASNRGTYYDLALKGSLLYGTFKNIPEGNYAARICVPKATSPIYATPRFQIQLNSGKRSTIHVRPDGTVILDPKFEAWPLKPSELTLTQQGNTVTLKWPPVHAPNLAGYRIYRRKPDGFYSLITTLDSSNTQLIETVSSKMAYKKRIYYAVSCFDSNGFESLWSESREVAF